MAFVAGFSNPATFQLVGAGSATTLAITGWTGSEEVQRLITTHSGTGGLQACLAGIYDFTANVTANYDLAAFPHATPPTIKAGAKGTVTLSTGTGANNKFTLGVLITKVNYASPVNGLVNYNFDVGLDATTVATVTYPT